MTKKFYETEIESWWYPTENGGRGNSFQVVVRDDLTGEEVARGPIRDTRLEAKQDDNELRSGQQHVSDWQKLPSDRLSSEVK